MRILDFVNLKQIALPLLDLYERKAADRMDSGDREPAGKHEPR